MMQPERTDSAETTDALKAKITLALTHFQAEGKMDKVSTLRRVQRHVLFST